MPPRQPSNFWTIFWLAVSVVAMAVLTCMAVHGAAIEHQTRVLPAPNRPASLVTAHVLADPKLTPGAIYADVTGEQATTRGYAQGVRNVPESVKRQVFAEYGIKDPKPGEYEVDHLISLELGGNNDIHNLWPESYVSKPLNAHVKDRLEDHLAAMVRHHQITLQEAQNAIAGDWTAAYAKYIGPLPR